MARYKVKTFNKISQIGLDKFSSDYSISDDADNPDAIMLRSYNLHDESMQDTVLAVGRAGAGVNNIPVEKISPQGIAVFNAPGANANSVKELVIAGLLISARNIDGAISYANQLSGRDIKKQVEAGKKQYAGQELTGKTLAVIGLGAIGYRVANAAVDMGMSVIGFDPALSVDNAIQLNPAIKQVNDLDELIAAADFVTIHVPLLEATKGLISKQRLANFKSSAVLLNFSRDQIVDEKALVKVLNDNKLSKYITDFPNEITINQKGVIALPHLGASTSEAEDNCAIMIADQLMDYLENGNIRNSVNLPSAVLSKKGKARLCAVHQNKPGVVAELSQALSNQKLNILEMLNKSRGDLAYTIIDLNQNIEDKTIEDLSNLSGIIKLRVI